MKKHTSPTSTPPSGVTRRDFMKKTTGAFAAAAVGTSIGAPMIVPERVFGANDTVRAAVLGVNGRGKSHIRGLQGLENVEVVTLCDPDDAARAGAAAALDRHRRAIERAGLSPSGATGTLTLTASLTDAAPAALVIEAVAEDRVVKAALFQDLLRQTPEKTRYSRGKISTSESREVCGWGGRIRTCECRYQKPVPYHLATPQRGLCLTETGAIVQAGNGPHLP